MASDAFMELSDPETWGESIDAQFGMAGAGRKKGAFEITSFSMSTEDRSDDDDDDDDKTSKHGSKHHTSHKHHSGGKGSQTANSKEHTIKKFTVKKPVDKGSLDLFLACLEKKRMAWANVFMREVGDADKQPWLWLEFQGVFVDKLDWSLASGAAGDEAKEQETVDFTFESILIKYSRQSTSGKHEAVKIKGWNTLRNDRQTQELEASVGGVVLGLTDDSGDVYDD
jgi:type VI secretion system Hcp family effector